MNAIISKHQKVYLRNHAKCYILDCMMHEYIHSIMKQCGTSDNHEFSND